MLNKKSVWILCSVAKSLRTKPSHNRVCWIILVILLFVSRGSFAAGGREEQSVEQSPTSVTSSAINSGTGLQGGQMQQDSVVNSTPISLQNLDDAAQTFISFYNNLLPVSKPKDVADICRALGTDDYIPQCEVLLSKRVKELQGLSGLTGAQFPEGTIIVNEDLKNAVDVKWKEVLMFGKTPQLADHHIRLFYSKIKDNWKVQKIDAFK